MTDDPAFTEPDARVHTRESFEFLANGAIDEVFPLFGAHGERAWAPGWDPRFVWPVPAVDRPGMVFHIAHGDRSAIWVNTSFDRDARRVQYVSLLPDTVATVVTLALAAEQLTAERGATRVSVLYERTALSQPADALVREMGERDRVAGPEWAAQINRYLASVAHSGARGAGAA